MPKDYYLNQRDKLMAGHRQMMGIGKPMLAQRFKEALADALIEKASSEFEMLLPEIPYIGGKDNPLTDTLIQMTSMLALYNVLKGHMTAEEIGELVYQMAVVWINRYATLASGGLVNSFSFMR